MTEQHVAKTFRHPLYAYPQWVSECSCGWRYFSPRTRSAAVLARREHVDYPEDAARER